MVCPFSMMPCIIHRPVILLLCQKFLECFGGYW
uniref:Uncharacterized protein n=1 Tax=Setaria viridis TaxID=4556 RepID=A0A4U6VGA7_SETVI|nr:hypothetical protein SEVIR_3G341210v2 [Setaria viridis]